MTLDEAINHCDERTFGDTACALEHRQLKAWLEELKRIGECTWHQPGDDPRREKDYKGRDRHILVLEKDGRLRKTWPIFYRAEDALRWAYVADLMPKDIDYERMY